MEGQLRQRLQRINNGKCFQAVGNTARAPSDRHVRRCGYRKVLMTNVRQGMSSKHLLELESG